MTLSVSQDVPVMNVVPMSATLKLEAASVGQEWRVCNVIGANGTCLALKAAMVALLATVQLRP